MKQIVFSFSLIIILTLGSTLKVVAQVTNDFELGDRNLYIAQCWQFEGTTCSTADNPISGTYSCRSGQLTGNPNYLHSPAIKFTSPGALTFKHKLTTWAGSTYKSLRVALEAANYPNNSDTTTILLYSYTYSASTANQVIFVNVQVSNPGVYRIVFKFIGAGGTGRGQLDDISIPGTYWSDPSNGCMTIVQANLWNGNTSDDWNLPANWSLNLVPNSTQSIGATIPSGLSVYPKIYNTGMSAANLIIANGATLTINPGKGLTVNGNTEINGSNALALKSDATSGNAAFVTSQTGTIAYPNNGSANIELYIKSCLTGVGCWHYFSSPLPDALSGIFAGNYLKSWDEVTGAWSDYITSSTSLFNPLQGYLVSNPNTGGVTTFHGQLNDGTLQQTLYNHTAAPPATAGEGWNLAGNPYPSEIDLNTTLNWTNIDKVVYYYDQAAGTYKPYNATTHVGTGSRYVPPMQGFFVHVSSGFSSGTLQFTDNNRTTTGNMTFYKDTPSEMLKLKVEAANGMNDETIVYFQSDMTAGYDQGTDCIFLTGADGAPQLNAVTSDNMKVTIEALPFAGINTVVPLEFTVNSDISSNYTLTASNLETFRLGTTITLEDKKTNTSQLLTTNPVYQFTFSNGDSPSRFLLHFYNPFYGINDKIKDQPDLQIYSFDHEVYLKDNSGHPDTGDCYLYDIMGNEIMHSPIAALTVNKYTVNLPNGYYIVRVITRDKIINNKIFIN